MFGCNKRCYVMLCYVMLCYDMSWYVMHRLYNTTCSLHVYLQIYVQTCIHTYHHMHVTVPYETQLFCLCVCCFILNENKVAREEVDLFFNVKKRNDSTLKEGRIVAVA